MNISGKEEKKVEYVELIYDLIFVYMVGRDNALLNNVQDGFVGVGGFISFALCTLSIIQIWNFSTFYINLFGRNGVRDHVFLMINMYLLYFVGESTRSNWSAYAVQYHVAWGLILVNTGIQYVIELHNHRADVWNRPLIKRMAANLFIEAGIVFAASMPGMWLEIILSAAAIAVGIILTFTGRSKWPVGHVDFMHLTERAMLYVVFTFGEMVIAVASYFRGDGHFHANTIYFSLLAFLIVVGLFLGYEVVYMYLINREGEFNGMVYMVIHIFIIFALNGVTVSLEFMREAEVDVLPKVLMMTICTAGYFLCLFLLGRHFKAGCHPDGRFILKMSALTAVFATLMVIFRMEMKVNILITALYVFAVFFVLIRMKAVQNAMLREKAE